MTSSLIVPVAAVDAILPHLNAENLELIHVLGWQLVAQKGQFKVGEKIVYFPPDSVLPFELSERFNVTKYLSKQRIKHIKLRGEPSFGLAMPPDDPSWEVGSNVANFYNVTKYEPPLRFTAADALPDHPLFPKYTSIENMRNFPNIFNPGEMVVLTEKIHGTNARVGIVKEELIINGEVTLVQEMMAGSHQLRRKKPENNLVTSLYWFPLSFENVQNLITNLGQKHKQVVVYGEVYGPKVQSFNYGVAQNHLDYRVFDILLDGNFLDYYDMLNLCQSFNVDVVPVIAILPFNLNEVKQYSEGKTLLMENNPHIREGVVAKPLHERNHPTIGRVILKYVSDSYLLKADKSDYTEQ